MSCGSSNEVSLESLEQSGRGMLFQPMGSLARAGCPCRAEARQGWRVPPRVARKNRGGPWVTASADPCWSCAKVQGAREEVAELPVQIEPQPRRVTASSLGL